MQTAQDNQGVSLLGMIAESDEREQRIAGIVSRALRSLDRSEEGGARKITVEKVRGWLTKIAEAC